jgi:rhodanese-related sulfurtransferase
MICLADLPAALSPAQLMDCLRTPQNGEWALLDVREEGEAAEGHPFGAVNLPYSRLEIDLPHLVPRRQTPLVLFDGGDGVADSAAQRLARLGYAKISVIAGGAQGWQAAGLPLFKGVHTFSKAFGEWVQHQFDVPEIGPDQLSALRASGNPHILIDGRPLPEHQAFTLPDAINCPNADLALRLPSILAADMPVVVHCAGRTRSIIGAQTMRDFGLPNPVVALRDGTQGWELSGRQRDIAANRPAPDPVPSDIAAATARARAVIAAQGLPTVTAASLTDWLAQDTRTTYLLDPRSDATPPDGFRAAHGTTLVQQTDRFIAVKGARVVLWDPCLVRSTFASLWLTRMGVEAYVLLDPPPPLAPIAAPAQHDLPPELTPQQLSDALAQGASVLDLRPAAAFHAQHLVGAQHALRARLKNLNLPPNCHLVLVADTHARTALVVADLLGMGHRPIGLVSNTDTWRSAQFATTSCAIQNPADDPETVRFCAGRHSGNLDDARTYLAWETGLLDRLSAAGLHTWPKISHPQHHKQEPTHGHD